MSDVIFPTVSSDWLKHETDPNIGRQNIKIVLGTGVVKSGTPLMAGVGAGEFLPCTAGSTPTGILLDGIDATLADVKCVQLIGNAEIISTPLSWAVDVDTTAEKNAILALLETNLKIFNRVAV